MTITKPDLKKKLSEVQRYGMASPYYKGTGVASNITETETETSTAPTLTIKTINRVNGNHVISTDDIKAKLFNPLPCMYWKCTGTPATNGDITLNKELRGLFIRDGNDYYCLGVTNDSNEFELRISIQGNEIRINNEFINIIAEHLVKNGVEV